MEKGRGGGEGRQRDGHRKNQRGKSSVGEGTLARALPADALRDSRPLWGATSPLPLHPHPSKVPPGALVGGGGANLHTLDRTPGEDIVRPSAGRLKTSNGRTTGDQTLLEVVGLLHRNG